MICFLFPRLFYSGQPLHRSAIGPVAIALSDLSFTRRQETEAMVAYLPEGESDESALALKQVEFSVPFGHSHRSATFHWDKTPILKSAIQITIGSPSIQAIEHKKHKSRAISNRKQRFVEKRQRKGKKSTSSLRRTLNKKKLYSAPTSAASLLASPCAAAAAAVAAMPPALAPTPTP